MTRGKNNKSDQELCTEDLIKKVCSEFADKIEKSFNSRFDQLETNIMSLSEQLDNATSVSKENKTEIENLNVYVDNMEQNTKKNMLRIHGLDQEAEGETLMQHFINFLKEKLKIDCTENDIDYVMRLPNTNNQPMLTSTVLVNFVNNHLKFQIFNAKKLLKNSGISIFEDLTKTRFELLMEAKKQLGKKMYGA